MDTGSLALSVPKLPLPSGQRFVTSQVTAFLEHLLCAQTSAMIAIGKARALEPGRQVKLPATVTVVGQVLSIS